jgi:ribonuclease E
VEDEETRKRLKEQAAKLKLPPGCGVIIRTNALGQSKSSLSRDLNALLRLWNRIGKEARRGSKIQLIYSDQDIILRALRDYLGPSIQEVLADDESAYVKAKEYMRAFMPRSKTKLIRYTERTPLFARFHLEPQIERIYDRRVELPSGGSLVIDRTEALVAVDVNSGRSTRAASQEQTAVDTNLEAASEVARQLRLRDIGGLIVVDFIDMAAWKNRRLVEKVLRDSMKSDKARFTVGKISPNGLLEINRQRIQQALHLRTHRPCPTCSGTGRTASPEMVGLNLIRRIEARGASGFTGSVRIALHPELADAFQNNRRQEIARLENEFDIRVEVIAASPLHRSEQEIDWEESESADPRPPSSVLRRSRASRGHSVSIEDAAASQAAAEAPESQPSSGKPRRPASRPASKRPRARRPRKTQVGRAPQAAEESAKRPKVATDEVAKAGPKKGAKRSRGSARRGRRGGGRGRRPPAGKRSTPNPNS